MSIAITTTTTTTVAAAAIVIAIAYAIYKICNYNLSLTVLAGRANV